MNEMVGSAYRSMMLLPQAYNFFKKAESENSLKELLKIGLWKGDYGLIKKFKEDASYFDLDNEEYAEFLVTKAIPHVRMMRSERGYELDEDRLNSILLELGKNTQSEKKQVVEEVILDMLRQGNQNVPKQYLLAKAVESEELMVQIGNRYNNLRKNESRKNIDSLFSTFCSNVGFGVESKLQEGDSSELFPIANHIFLTRRGSGQGIERIVFKENQKLYVDFSKLDGYNKEKEILAKVDHPNIVKYLGSEDIEGIEFLKLEYVRGETLSKYTKPDADGSLLSLEQSSKIIYDIARTINYLGSQGIMYNDIKDTNFMYDGQRVVMLDFGMSHLFDEAVNSESKCMSVLSTPKYIPPEMMTSLTSYKNSDVFQLGVLFHELLTGIHPFDRVNFKEGDSYRESEVIKYGLANLYNEPEFSHEIFGRKTLRGLVESMLSKNPFDRVSMEEVERSVYNFVGGGCN